MANRFLISTMQRYNHSLVYPYFAKAISKKFFSGGWGEASHIYSHLKLRHFWGKSRLLSL